ncbi:MAG: hypothetical protein GY898_16050 [Proteobacteria bacterium]|nr:hypothetical protein [Pseudomonadota bacterium]
MVPIEKTLLVCSLLILAPAAAGCAGSSVDLATYTEIVQSIVPTDGPGGSSDSGARSAIDDGGIDETLFQDLLDNVADPHDQAVLLRNWIGWSGDAPEAETFDLEGETIAPGASTGWMPFREDMSGGYFEDAEGSAPFDGDGDPRRKNGGVVNAAFVGGGSDSVLGAAAAVDLHIEGVNGWVDIDLESTHPDVTVDSSVDSVQIPGWFGLVEDS